MLTRSIFLIMDDVLSRAVGCEWCLRPETKLLFSDFLQAEEGLYFQIALTEKFSDITPGNMTNGDARISSLLEVDIRC